ncbi:hypothetical protein Slin15195_G021500 [Septoria linicola]|uniref:Uncharacterized protein n=1 Tax=Septoria linicola TaxID=215465 RepID=A0A9Q9AMT9_9PEZI|nr:hypothetical protein Slin15195_G021500 [Septoria linicola]
MKDVQADTDYSWQKFRKPNFGPPSLRVCDAVDLVEGNEHVMAYAYTDAGDLGKNWSPANSEGSGLSESGKTYLKAMSKYG